MNLKATRTYLVVITAVLQTTYGYAATKTVAELEKELKTASIANTEAEKNAAAAREKEIETLTNLIAARKKKTAQDEAKLVKVKVGLAKDTKGAVLKVEEKSDVDKKQDELIAKLASIPGDDDRLDGDVLRFKTNVHPFTLVGSNDAAQYCAPRTSKAKVTKESDGDVYIRFKSLPATKSNAPTPLLEELGITSRASRSKKASSNEENLIDCSRDARFLTVSEDDQYVISRANLDEFGYQRKGIIFGGLVVPFKYYLGGDKRVSTSTTVAPYIGYRTKRVLGLNVMPIVSAGLGLVQVNTTTLADDGTESASSETKPALSAAMGLRFTSQKNKNFSAGLLIGKDKLSRKDRASDPTVNEKWISLYVGLDFK
jgi:hypothetical protein